MRVVVDLGLCQSHGECVVVAEDLFQLDDDDQLHWVEEPDESRRTDVERAAQLCPVMAILIED